MMRDAPPEPVLPSGWRPGERIRRKAFGRSITSLRRGRSRRASTGTIRSGRLPYLKWAMELQFIGQAGVTYSRDPFDRERFQRIREIAAEMLAAKSEMPLEKVKELFCSEHGFQTPKLDTRAAIFRDGKILLVRENDGRWSLPGGWVDVNESIRSNTEKEVREEAGLTVAALRLIAAQDRNRHNPPPYAYGVCKVFVLCG